MSSRFVIHGKLSGYNFSVAYSTDSFGTQHVSVLEYQGDKLMRNISESFDEGNWIDIFNPVEVKLRILKK